MSNKSHSRLKGWLCVVSGLLLLVPFMALVAYFIHSFIYLGTSPGLGGLVKILSALFIALSILLITRGRQMLAVDAASLLEHDKRPSILYLRPFSEEKKFPPQKGLALLRSKRRIKLQGWTPPTYEEQIAQALRQVGPFIAVGNPKEKLPELGAARMYVDNSEWQERVKQLITRAGLIFMQIGESAGFLWELDQAVKTAKPHKLILGLPFIGKGGEKARQAQYDNFRMKSLSVLPKPLPEKLGDAQFLYFDEGWSPHLFTPYKSVRLPQSSLTEHPEQALQMQALKELHSEFMLASTPYWVRGMIIILILSSPVLLVLLAVLFEKITNG